MPFSLHQGDALMVMATLPDQAVDCVITDPPYNSGGRTTTERTSRTARAKYVSGGVRHHLADFDGENKDQHSYGYWLTLNLTEAYRLSKPGSPALIFTDWRQVSTTADALQAAGWTWQGIATWHKPAARPRKGGLRQDSEYIVWGTKGRIAASQNPVYLPGLYSASQPRKDRQHITQKPLAVMRQLVRICPPGGTVLDFCCGSGSTGVAALQQGLDFIGIEMSPHYAGIARSRLETALNQTTGPDDLGLAGPEEQ
ncbi:DNA-methyltransferase [Streptomyces triticirhizae]|uniref:Methyltransferase n=1 Tax=Streptomyces triticirhizae TaxID=2483353 RepID=A0A3M2MCL2_9ACTN|nr:site-specific DNA-methyltransferase [Streptomyces triticirhizae]RMI46740.1 site-specific DNA-methyltransferase [Streptomyces triticirhizae]